MAASVFDSPLYAQLFPTGEAGRLFTDSAAIRAMLIVEGTLAKVQGAQGVIPELSAAAIQRASMEVQIDPGALAQETGQNGVPVPALVQAFRAEMNAPEHAQFVHWGATSQDVIDTALMLRLRQLSKLVEADLRAIVTNLADQAMAHAETPMAGRTYAQHATPASWGAVCADWGMALCDALDALPALRQSSLWVSLSGAAGTGAALGACAAGTRRDLAAALGLGDPQRSWHTDRGPIARVADWLASTTQTLGRMGSTLVALASSEIAEVSLGAVGASSTMPQKQNPVAASTLQTYGIQMTGLRASLAQSALHQHQRDGAAWFSEWITLPQLCLTAASAAHVARSLTNAMHPDPNRMQANLHATGGTIFAEALSFELAQSMARPDAQTAVKEICAEASATGIPLADVASARFPGLNPSVFDPTCQMGEASNDARAFVKRARDI